jgi:hypothetical protein
LTGNVLIAIHGMHRRGGDAWGAVLATNKGITCLDLQNNRLGDNACSMYVLPRNSDSCGACPILSRACTARADQSVPLYTRILAALKSNPYLQTLNLADNRMGIKSAAELREVFDENITLTNLDISFNHIRPQDFCMFAQTLATNNALKTLSIAWNGIGDKSPPVTEAGSPESLGQTQKTAASKVSGEET